MLHGATKLRLVSFLLGHECSRCNTRSHTVRHAHVDVDGDGTRISALRLTAALVKAAKPMASCGSTAMAAACFCEPSKRVRRDNAKLISPNIVDQKSNPTAHDEPNLGLGLCGHHLAWPPTRLAAREADRQRREIWKDRKPGDPRSANDPVERRRAVRGRTQNHHLRR